MVPDSRAEPITIPLSAGGDLFAYARPGIGLGTFWSKMDPFQGGRMLDHTMGFAVFRLSVGSNFGYIFADANLRF